MFPKSLFRPHFRVLVRGVSGGLLALLVAASSAAAQSRPDQVLWLNSRGDLTTDSGQITEYSLARVTIETGGREKNIDSANVERVTFGQVPTSFLDGRALMDRSEFADAAASFKKAADDASSRPLVKARARFFAGLAFLRAGATDGSNFAKAKVELSGFVSDYPDSGDLGTARWNLGRAQRLSGDAKEAAETWAGLYSEAPGGTPNAGYRATLCFRAGVDAAHAWLAAGDTAKARELFLGMESPMASAVAQAEDGSPERTELQWLQAEARLGEGFVLLATKANSQAKTFFSGQIGGANEDAALHYGAVLGLAEALLADGKAREAQLEFAKVSAIDHTDRDRTARALVGLARAALQLPEASAKTDAKNWLRTVADHYGDTPAALDAKELSKSI